MPRKVHVLTPEETQKKEKEILKQANNKARKLIARLTSYNYSNRSGDINSLWDVISKHNVSQILLEQAFSVICAYAREPGNYKTRDLATRIKSNFELKLRQN